MNTGLIFISYRREDTAGYARAIYDQLVERFSKERVFMDVDAIEPGLPFDEAIEKAIGQCVILLALIGRNWLSQGADASPRINDPKDYVRLEISAALSRNVRVLPVLIDGARMPSELELPESLRKLSQRHGLEVRHSSFRSDVENLLSTVTNIVGKRVNRWVYWLSVAVAIGALSLICFQLYRNLAPSPKPLPLPMPNAEESSIAQPVGNESEPNNTARSSNSIPFGGSVQGVIEAETLDFFKFTTPGDFKGKIRIILRKLTSKGFRAVVTIYDKHEQPIMERDAEFSTPVSFVFDSAPNSTYFVSVKVGMFSIAPSGPYELEILPD